MTIQFVDTYRTTCITALQTAVGAGGAGGKLHLYGSPKPSTKGGATGLSPLVTFTCAYPSMFSTILTGVGTVDVTGMAEAALAGGVDPGTVAVWARLTTSADVFVADMDVGGTGSGADLTLDNTSIVGSGPASTITITSLTITAMGA